MATAVIRGASTVLELIPNRNESWRKRFNRFKDFRFAEELKYQESGLQKDWEQVGKALQAAISKAEEEQYGQSKG